MPTPPESHFGYTPSHPPEYQSYPGKYVQQSPVPAYQTHPQNDQLPVQYFHEKHFLTVSYECQDLVNIEIN